MSIIEEISGIIFSPQKTLESVSKKEDITSAFIIVLIASILSGIHSILLQYMQVFFPYIILIIIFVVSPIVGLIMWAISAGMCRLISMLFGGTGNYKKILQLLGYACVIHLIFIPIQILFMMVLPILSTIIQLLGYACVIHQILFMMALPILSTIILLINIIWFVILTVFAIKTSENISIINAFLIGVISFIPFSVYFIIVAVTIFSIFM